MNPNIIQLAKIKFVQKTHETSEYLHFKTFYLQAYGFPIFSIFLTLSAPTPSIQYIACCVIPKYIFSLLSFVFEPITSSHITCLVKISIPVTDLTHWHVLMATGCLAILVVLATLLKSK